MTEKTIFYSWQSDKENSINRGFIEDCIKKALAQFNKRLLVQSADRPDDAQPNGLTLEKDTTGAPGMSPVVDTIKQRITATKPDRSLTRNREKLSVLTEL
jgi:hypothetical protein